MTIQLKNDEIHQLRGESREFELKNESLLSENKQIGALRSQLERMGQYVKQARENEK
jgi:HAMP domain-containing protein